MWRIVSDQPSVPNRSMQVIIGADDATGHDTQSAWLVCLTSFARRCIFGISRFRMSQRVIGKCRGGGRSGALV